VEAAVRKIAEMAGVLRRSGVMLLALACQAVGRTPATAVSAAPQWRSGRPPPAVSAASQWRSGRPPRVAATMSARPRVLCLDSDGVAASLAALADYDVVSENGISDERVDAILSSGCFEGLVLRSANTCSARTLDAAGGGFRVVGRAGIGLDNIDVETCRARGIAVLNTPTASVSSVAELALTLMLCAVRRVPEARDSLLAGRWDRACLEGSSLRGKRLGVLGFGAIGQCTAELVQGLGMRVCTLETSSRAGEALARGLDLVTMAELLSQSDVVSTYTSPT
jgi:D-3-phosphoglycerate dehydrogenase